MNAGNEKQSQLMAALGHTAVLIPFIGIAVPLIVWACRRTESPRLGFQAMQALIYQGLGAAGYLLYFLITSAIGLATLPISVGLTSMVQNESVNGLSLGEFLVVIFILLMGALMIIGFTVQCILWPAYLALGLWAAYMTLKGYEFRYPILGNLLSRRMEKAPPPIPVAAI